MEELVAINKILTVNTLENYLEKHPEDALKWMDHLDPILHPKPSNYPLRNRRLDLLPADFDRYNIIQDLETPFINDDTMCGYCRRTWESTSAHAISTLLCGHKYHTICSILHQYETRGDCIVEGCAIDTSRIARELFNRTTRFNANVENVLLDVIKESAEFKADIKKLKGHIRTIYSKYGEVTKFHRRTKRKLLNKHIFNIRQIQYDMNAAVRTVKTSEQYLVCRSELKKYRSMETKIFRKYHVDLRDLIRQRIVHVGNWNLRYTLQRHGHILRPYKFGIRIYPGAYKWKEVDESESDSEGESEEGDVAADEPIVNELIQIPQENDDDGDDNSILDETPPSPPPTPQPRGRRMRVNRGDL